MKSDDTIQFDCPYCGQGLEAPVEMAGLFVTCPGCGGLLPVSRKGALGGDPLRAPTVKVNLPPGVSAPKRSERVIKIKRRRP